MDPFSNYAVYSVTNPLEHDKVVYYDNKPFLIKTKQTLLVPYVIAEHIAKYIAMEIIQFQFADRYGSLPFLEEVKQTLMKLQTPALPEPVAMTEGDAYTKIVEQLNSLPKTNAEVPIIPVNQTIPTPAISQNQVIDPQNSTLPQDQVNEPMADVLGASVNALPKEQEITDKEIGTPFPSLNTGLDAKETRMAELQEMDYPSLKSYAANAGLGGGGTQVELITKVMEKEFPNQ